MYAANDADETLRAHRGWPDLVSIRLWLAVRNVILRETALGPVAQVIDKLPPPIAPLAFILFWCTLLLGWCIPIILGLRLLRRKLN